MNSFRDAVWLSLLDSKRSVRYFHRLAQRFQLKNKLIVTGISLGAFTTGLLEIKDPSPLWPAIGISFTIALASMWSLVSNYPDKARKAAELETALANLSTEWEQLWRKVDALEEEEIENQWTKLDEKENTITQTLASDLPESKQLNQQSAEETYQVIQGEYHHEPTR